MVTILVGTNDYARRKALDKLLHEFVAEHGDIAVERLDGEGLSYDRLHEAVVSMPFLASQKLVVVSGLSVTTALASKVEDVIALVPETTHLVIVEAKVDKRGVYYKTLRKQPGFVEFGDPDERSLATWLVQAAKERDSTLSTSDAHYLVERVGANQLLLEHELEKLSLYQPKITRQTIDLLTDRSPHSTIFNLLDSAFSGDLRKTMQIYAEQRSQRVEPQAILALIGWQLHILAVVKTAGQRTTTDIAKEAGISPYSIQKSQTIVRRISLAHLKQLIHQALDIDIRLKSEALDADSAVQNLLLAIADK